LQENEQMVGSIDPGREILRAIQWRASRRSSVWNSRRGNHLGQRSSATASIGRTYGCKRTDPKNPSANLAGRGPSTYASPWLVDLLKRKSPKLAAVALANKTARIAWKLMTTGEVYDARRRLPMTPIAA